MLPSKHVDFHAKWLFFNFKQEILIEAANLAHNENLYFGRQLVAYGQTEWLADRTDMTKIIVVFDNFTNVPKTCFSVTLSTTKPAWAELLAMTQIFCWEAIYVFQIMLKIQQPRFSWTALTGLFCNRDFVCCVFGENRLERLPHIQQNFRLETCRSWNINLS
jgi:hypothetical protein